MSGCCCPPVIFGPGDPAPPGEAACISTDPDNQLREGSDGCLYVPPTAPAEPCVVDGGGLAVDDNGCLAVVPGPGLETGDDGVQVCLSDQPDNTARFDDQGCLYVPAADTSPGSPEPVCVSDEDDNITHLDGQGCVYTPMPRLEMRAEVIVYEDDGEFNPADYPGLQYIRVRAVGGGGGSGGGVRSTVGSNITTTQAGGGGSYAESVFNVDELPVGSIPVWVGKGGAGGERAEPGQTPTAGGNGTWSSFGGSPTPPDLSGLVIAVGGTGGGASAEPGWGVTTSFGGMTGAANPDHLGGLLASKGQITVPGSAGLPSWVLGPEVLGVGASMAFGGAGGINPLAGLNAGSASFYDNDPDRNNYAYGGSSLDGNLRYGAGGTATVGGHEGSTGPQGNPGADGVVIVEVFTARLVA